MLHCHACGNVYACYSSCELMVTSSNIINITLARETDRWETLLMSDAKRGTGYGISQLKNKAVQYI